MYASFDLTGDFNKAIYDAVILLNLDQNGRGKHFPVQVICSRTFFSAHTFEQICIVLGAGARDKYLFNYLKKAPHTSDNFIKRWVGGEKDIFRQHVISLVQIIRNYGDKRLSFENFFPKGLYLKGDVVQIPDLQYTPIGKGLAWAVACVSSACSYSQNERRCMELQLSFYNQNNELESKKKKYFIN